jgi:ribonucleotide reductase beta subunit family protein with ferritin-like domain
MSQMPDERAQAAAAYEARGQTDSLGTAEDALASSPTWRVFTKPGCPWCDRAAEALRDAGEAFEHIQCADAGEYRSRARALGLPTAGDDGPVTFPQVYDADRHVGGHDALVEYLDEPLLRDDSARRFTPFPLRHVDLWDMYKRAVASFWTAEEVSLTQDVDDWQKLSDDERHFVKHVLAFFAGADGIVMENVQANFGVEVRAPEARAFYAYQAFNESVHSEAYGTLIDTLIADPAERERLFDAMTTVPAVRRKAAWATKWLAPGRPFAERLLAFACVEGVLFSGSFCAIFWLKQRGLMPGLGLSNQFIARDEGLHQEFAVLLYSKLRRRLPQSTVERIVREAVENEKEFITEAIPCRMVGMNAALMAQYVEFVADRLLLSLGYARAYPGATNPFPWMELISLGGKDNFFERFSSEYQKAGVMGRAEDRGFALDEAF